jgi:broad specificity phosphatase PhoE
VTCLVLVRHGQVPGIDPERFRGRSNLELTARGRRDAQLTAARIAAHRHPAAILTSPMQRCIETGRPIAAACSCPQQVLDSFNDIDYGVWLGKTHQEVRESSPDAYRLWRTSPELAQLPGGESLQEVAARIADGLRLILERFPNDTIVLVGHDVTNRVLLLQALGLPLAAFWRLAQDPCGISEIVWINNTATLIRMNETAHLSGAATPP